MINYKFKIKINITKTKSIIYEKGLVQKVKLPKKLKLTLFFIQNDSEKIVKNNFILKKLYLFKFLNVNYLTNSRRFDLTNLTLLVNKWLT